MARPPSIRWFERIAYLSLALSVVNVALIQRAMYAAAIPNVPDGRRAVVVVALVLMLVVYLPLIHRAARRAGKWARMMLTVLLGIHLLGLLNLPAILDYGGPSAVIAVIQFPISALLIWLLFRADSARWFSRDAPVDVEIFR